MSDDTHIHALWFEESSHYRWPEDTLHLQAQRWRAAHNSGLDPAPLRYCCELGTAPEPDSVVDLGEIRRAMHRKRSGSMHAVRTAPYVAPDEPEKPVLAEPTDREPAVAHLLHALFTKPVSDLRGKNLTEIAGKKVPKRITENEIEMALYCTKPNRKSIEKMTTILMSESATAAAVATFKLRDEKMKDTDTDYELPPDHQIGQQLDSNRLRIAA